MKKIFFPTILLCVILVVSVFALPLEAQAASESDLTFKLDSDGKSYSVSACKTTASNQIVIPSTYNGKPVTGIGYRAFYNCSNLTSITIPDSVTSIGPGAFYYCTSLTSITIPDSVTSIGDEAFYNCSSLTSITIPNSVTSIGDSVFNGCSSLESMTIPFVPGLFFGHIFGTTSYAGSIANTKSYYYEEDDFGTLIYTTTTYYIPAALQSVTVTGGFLRADVFSDCPNLTNVTLGDCVTGIGNYAFQDCTNLTSVTIGSSVTSIGHSVFEGCSNLTEIRVNEENTQYTSDEYGVLFNKEKTVLIRMPNRCPSNYTIPNSVTSIGMDAFYCCTNLNSITIPNSVTSIGNYAFQGCTSLTSVTIPNSVTSIGDYAFQGCTSLTGITIPNSVTSIGYSAFNNCTSLNYNIHKDGKYLGNTENPYIVLVDTVSKSFESFQIHPKTKILHSTAFEDCTSLTNITIPDSVTSIGPDAFYDCGSLTSITIPDSVTSIGSYAFDDCGSLNHVAYTGTESQWNSISIGYANTNLTSATRHYETRFQNVDNCEGNGVYCPVCKEYLVYEAYKNDAHSYGDWVVTKPATFEADGEKEKICSVCGDCVTETIPMQVSSVSQWGVTLADDIGATFYLNVENCDLDNTFVTIQFDGALHQYSLHDLATADGKYVVKVNVAAAQMYDDIIIQVCSGDNTSKEMRYTIRQYAEYVLSGNYSAETKYLVQAMLNYGASAQTFFAYNTNNLANSGYELTDIPQIPEASPSSASIGKVNGITYYGASLNHEAKISVKFYFTVTGNINDYTFTDAKGNTYQAKCSANLYYIEVLNINPTDYDEIIKIIVHDGSGVMMVDYSPLRYISRKFYGSDNTNLVNMVAALYRYHKAAEAYVA